MMDIKGDSFMENQPINPTENTTPIEDTTPPTSLLPEKPKKAISTPLLIILGLVILVAAPIIYLSLSQTSPTNEAEVIVAPIPTPVPFFLTIDNPQAETVNVDGQVLVSGSTLPGTYVVILTEADEVVLEVDENGNFEDTIFLGETGGLLTIQAIADDGDELEQTFSIAPTSDTSSLPGSVFASSDVLGKNDNRGNASETANRNVKSAETKVSPQFKIKTNNAPEEKGPKVKQFTEAKTAARTAAKPEKINPAEMRRLALMGDEATPSGNIKRVRMEAEEATPGAKLQKRHAISGVIIALDGDTITIAHQIHRDRVASIFINQNTIVKIKDNDAATTASLEVGMRIVAIGEPVEEGILAARLHVIPGKATGVFERQPVATESGDPTDDGSATDSGQLPTPTPTTEPETDPTPTSLPEATPTPADE
jgi:hypothetical protein